MLTDAQVRERIQKRVDDVGVGATARELGVSRQYVYDILAGERTLGPAVLRGLGLVKRTIYEKAPA